MKALEMILAGTLLLGGIGAGVAYAQGEGQRQKATAQELEEIYARRDSIKLHEIMMPHVRNKNNIIYQISPTVKIGNKEIRLNIRVKKPHEALEVEIYIDSLDMFKEVYLDESTIYAIHKNRSAFTVKEYSIIYSPSKHRVTYTLDKEEISEDPPGSGVLKVGEDYIFKTLKKIINKSTFKELLKVLDYRQFVRDVYEKGKAIEEGNLMIKDHVYIEEFPIHAATDIFDKPEKKFYKWRMERGEKAIDGFVIFFTLREGQGIFCERSDIDYETIKLRK